MIQLADYQQHLEGKVILVVDDEADSLEVAETLLDELEMDIITATNGKEALEIAIRKHPDFIITDLSMPEMTGWDLVAALKQDRATLEIPVIALTAHAMAGDRHRAIAAGFHNYLTKPLNPDTFVTDFLAVVLDTIV